MKGVGLILIGIMSLFAANTTKGQTLAAKDSAYNNWYYDSRELLYQKLKGTQYDVIFFGNSITERGPWEELLGKRYVVGNRGIGGDNTFGMKARSEEHTSELQSRENLVCRLLLEKKKRNNN